MDMKAEMGIPPPECMGKTAGDSRVYGSPMPCANRVYQQGKKVLL